jgi:hypothetical protein
VGGYIHDIIAILTWINSGFPFELEVGCPHNSSGHFGEHLSPDLGGSLETKINMTSVGNDI